MRTMIPPPNLFILLYQIILQVLCLFMTGRKLLLRYILSPRKLSSMSDTSVSVDRTRNEFANKPDVFKEDQITFKEPFGQFKSWYEEACATPGISEPRAMCLATSTRTGIPSARFVILRGYNTDGFKFFTNYCSRKGNELNENPNAALVFYWECLKKSIRIEGTVSKTSEEESVQFFHSRPKANQIEAAFSKQSQPISSKHALSEQETKFKEQYLNCDSIPKPKEWGGYILKPLVVEFWQGQSNHLHDRIRFRIPKHSDVVDNILLHWGENGWVYEILQP